MHEDMILRWNEVVGESDVVYHLGDFGFAGVARLKGFCDQLNGKKIIIRGNHDPSPGRLLRIGFSEVYDQLEIEIGWTKIILCHYPYAPTGWWQKLKMWWRGYDLRYFDRRPPNKGGWLIHGHVHTAWQVCGRQINVGVDRWHGKPVSEIQIADIIRRIDG